MGVDGEMQELFPADVGEWRAWLDAHEDESDGIWLILAKKAAAGPESLTYAQALDEALCSGWIDGQRRGRDELSYLQRFTPRRRASLWSARNVQYIARLSDEGRMRTRGAAEVERAQADGRWERAYAGSATIEMPDDLAAALRESAAATATFAAFNSQNRFAVLHRVVTAATPATRARRIGVLIEKLERGE